MLYYIVIYYNKMNTHEPFPATGLMLLSLLYLPLLEELPPHAKGKNDPKFCGLHSIALKK